LIEQPGQQCLFGKGGIPTIGIIVWRQRKFCISFIGIDYLRDSLKHLIMMLASM